MYPRAACLPYAISVVWRDAAKQRMVAYPLHPQALQLNVRRAVMTTVILSRVGSLTSLNIAVATAICSLETSLRICAGMHILYQI